MNTIPAEVTYRKQSDPCPCAKDPAAAANLENGALVIELGLQVNNTSSARLHLEFAH